MTESDQRRAPRFSVPASGGRGDRCGATVAPHTVEQQQRQYLRFSGRQLACEHLTRRVVRYENDGSVTVIADSFNRKRLNSPNDIVPIPMAASGSSTRLVVVSFMKASSMWREVQAIRPAGSIRGSGNPPASCRANANYRPMSTRQTPADDSTSS